MLIRQSVDKDETLKPQTGVRPFWFILCDTSHSLDHIGRHLLVTEWPLDRFEGRAHAVAPGGEPLENDVRDNRLPPQVKSSKRRKARQPSSEFIVEIQRSVTDQWRTARSNATSRPSFVW